MKNTFEKIRKYCSVFIAVLFIVLSGCESNRFDVDIADIEVDFEVKRLDRDFFDLKKESDLKLGHQRLYEEYGTFYKRYIQNILSLGHVKDPAIVHPVRDFLTNEHIDKLADTVHTAFEDLSLIEKDFAKAFKYYRYHFPDRHVPDVVTFIGGFNYNIAATDSALGIGLEFYLGSDREIYRQTGMPMYKVKKMNPDYLVYDALRGWVLSEYSDPEKEDFLLAGILEYGKALYVMDAVFPFAEDHLKIGFTPEEIEWCRQNDWNIWQSMMDSEMLYSKDQNALRRFIGDAPFTPGMPEESPGRVGIWVGRQIVKAYMKRHPETTLPELMELRDHKRILSQSKYKPDK